MKVANYCHHCPWKCITPHLRAHSIKETEGAINRWLLTLIHRPKEPDGNQHFSLSFMLQTFLLLTSNLGHCNGSPGFGTLNVVFRYYHLKMVQVCSTLNILEWIKQNNFRLSIVMLIISEKLTISFNFDVIGNTIFKSLYLAFISSI